MKKMLIMCGAGHATSTIVPDSIKDKVINGVALLTGIGTEQVWEQVKAALEK
ncbi:hypothetical protein PT285_09170 [Lactobacillus sp. ESL0791]|uniref:hypothetical protein n=1 Tax=Lactobacillus sp. ESL0791 TaxID=2983234 RepID=UPI0023F88959|nr:hypothetical protein [Lactobacillus sp. ESL0791]MDF7639569.1 hypothetical protein [Lactobacillus sp. ESL0791]